jgi:hypothetical protein
MPDLMPGYNLIRLFCGAPPFRHCEERSDEAIQFLLFCPGLLRCARNDGRWNKDSNDV